MDSLNDIISEIIRFRNEREWEQFHNAKDLALALSIETAELNELFLWKQADEANKEKVKEELADVFMYGLLLAHKLDLNVLDIIKEKLKTNAAKYPIEKSKGKSTKYTDL